MDQIQKRNIYMRLTLVYQLERGFTLVELMVAIVVLSIGFFAAASMQISAADANLFAHRSTETIHLAQDRIDELMALEYTQVFTDPDLIDDTATTSSSEPYIDVTGNGLWDFNEPYADSNGNGVWDAAHVDDSPPPGYTVTWSVTDGTPISLTKRIAVYVTRHDNKKTVILTCIKSRG